MYLQPTSTYGSLIPGSNYIRSLVLQGEITKEAAKRLRWFDYYGQCGNARKTCRYFGISAQTFYRWKARFDPYDLTTLEEESRRPHAVRRPETSLRVIERIMALREEHPRWSRDKLAVLLEREGIKVSGSTVGRVMARLKARGLLVEPASVRLAKLARKRRRKPRYAVRRSKEYKVEAPGDLVQVDTLRVRLLPNLLRIQFTAHDVISKYAGLKTYKRLTSGAAAEFLHHLKMKFPFRIRAIQIDGGSEFMDEFEAACRRRKILLFVNPPHCPEMNGGVERSNRTHREEFYEVKELSLNVEELNQQVEEYEREFNYDRPHEALEMKTPHAYYLQWKKNQSIQASRMA
ncbi:MAG: Integrase catalytic region [Candidatus Aminicenantes bacterium]|nr:Integrase catalytic region [Candidatus Aminicenantes bacterium]